jgi:predicted DNA-binding antitoxin AbrB/MazE fold protein
LGALGLAADRKERTLTRTIEAVVENGLIRPLEKLEIHDQTRIRVTIEPSSETNGNIEAEELDDPFEGLSMKTGIRDLAENFDDYRFGRRTP